MPFARQRRAVPHCRTASQPTAGPQSEKLSSETLSSEMPPSTLLPVVPGFRYLLRRVPLTLSALALSATLLCSGAQARSSKIKSAPKPTGVWAWTSGSQTYMRARPGVQTPPVAKVARHTKLFVWGKFNGWYRVETTDHKFGWVHNEYLNSPDLEKVAQLSHFKAKQASDRTEDQTMYGSVEMLRKHYERYGSDGARKGLTEMGVRVASLPKPQKVEPSRSAQAKADQQKAIQAKMADMQAKLAAAKAELAKAKAERLAAEKEAQAAREQAAHKPTPKVAAVPTAKPDAKPIAKVAKPAKVAQKPKPTTVAQSNGSTAETGSTPQPEKVEATTPPTPTTVNATTPVGNPLVPAMPNPTSAGTPLGGARVPVPIAPIATHKPAARPVPKAAARPNSPQILAPAIPITRGVPKSAARPAAPAWQVPNITPEDLLRAREEHMRQRNGASAPASASGASFTPMSFSPYDGDEASQGARFMEMSFTRQSLPTEQFTPNHEAKLPATTLGLDYEKPALAAEPSKSEAAPVEKTIVEQKIADATKANAQPAAPKTLLAKAPTKKAAAKAPVSGPHRGGSPRDLLRVAKADFGQNLASQALSYRGRPYIHGAASPSRGFDCSGLVYYLLNQRGYHPPRTAAGLASYGKPVPVGQLQPGDLVLFANTYKRGVSHVGVYLGNNNFVHAATSGTGVRVDSLGSPYYCRKYYGARRVQ